MPSGAATTGEVTAADSVPGSAVPALPAAGWAARLGALCGVLAAALAMVWSARPLAHDDVFWHLRTADWILRHGAVPTTDPFSYTRFGAPWISHEWGFAMLAWVWERAFGLPGLQALTAVAVLLTGTLVARRAAAPWAVVGPLFGIALLASGPAIFLRPALVALAMLAALLLALDLWWRSGRRWFLLAALGVIWLWANVHSNVVFGLFLIALQAAGAWWAAWRDRRRMSEHAASGGAGPVGAARALSLTFLVGVLLSLCNPNGVRALLFPLVLHRILWGSGIAWDLGQFETRSALQNLPLVLFAALLALALLRLRRWPGSAAPWEVCAVLLYLGLAFWAPRFVPELTVVALPLVARGLSAAAPSHARLTAGLALGVALVLASTAVASRPAWPPRTVAATFPEGAVRFLRGASLQVRLFHNSNQGGFLLWSLAQPVFWDGRTDVFASLTREVTTIPFPRVVERYGVDALLLGEREMRDLRVEVESERWGLVYWDDVSALYLRRAGPLGARLGELELKIFRGLSDGSELPAIAGDPVRRAAARQELARLLAAQPENRRALYFAAVLELAGGDAVRARDLLRSALALGENAAVRSALEAAEGLAAQAQGAH